MKQAFVCCWRGYDVWFDNLECGEIERFQESKHRLTYLINQHLEQLKFPIERIEIFTNADRINEKVLFVCKDIFRNSSLVVDVPFSGTDEEYRSMEEYQEPSKDITHE